MRTRVADGYTQVTDTVPLTLLYLMALESRLIIACFSRTRSAFTK